MLLNYQQVLVSVLTKSLYDKIGPSVSGLKKSLARMYGRGFVFSSKNLKP